MFTSEEMGEDVLLALREYLALHRDILNLLNAECQTIQAALNNIRPITRPPERK